jgi:hypothetical protein
MVTWLDQSISSVRAMFGGPSVTRRLPTGALDSSKALRAVGSARVAAYQCVSEWGGKLGLRSVFIKNEDRQAFFYRGLVPSRSRR